MKLDHQTDLSAPFGVDRLLEIRTSRMKKMPGLEITSGIDKIKCDGPMKIDRLGLEGDEHDPTFHGGPDKAILGCKLRVSLSWTSGYLTEHGTLRLLISLSRLAEVLS